MRVIALSDGHAGNRNQAEALARALGGECESWIIDPPSPWRWFAPAILPGALARWPSALRAKLSGPAPDLVIACGRQAAMCSRLLKRHWPSVFTVQILDPRRYRADFDLIVCPAHDGLHGHNVLVSLCAMNAIDEAWLSAARGRFMTLAALPRPITSILIGGDSPMLPMRKAELADFLNRIRGLPDQAEGSLWLTTSRRTPRSAVRDLRAMMNRPNDRFWSATDAGENPFAGMLALADRIVVTPDSVNMLSEAVAVGVPVYTECRRAPKGKLAEFHVSLRERGLLLNFDQPVFPRPPLRETANIAALVLERFAQRHE